MSLVEKLNQLVRTSQQRHVGSALSTPCSEKAPFPPALRRSAPLSASPHLSASNPCDDQTKKALEKIYPV